MLFQYSLIYKFKEAKRRLCTNFFCIIIKYVVKYVIVSALRNKYKRGLNLSSLYFFHKLIGQKNSDKFSLQIIGAIEIEV